MPNPEASKEDADLSTNYAVRPGRLKVHSIVALFALVTALVVIHVAQAPIVRASASSNGAPMGTNPFGYLGVSSYGSPVLCDPNYATDGYPDNATAYGNYGCQLEENTNNLLAEAQALVTPIPGRSDGKALADLGYNLIQLDNGWQGPRVNGVLTPNPSRYCVPADCPNGTTADFTNLINQIRGMSGPVTHYPLEVGIYSDTGSGIGCAAPTYDTDNGLAGHENQDAQTFASWNITYLKLDTTCGGQLPNELTLIKNAFATYAPGIRIDVYWNGDQTGNFPIWRLDCSSSGSCADQCGCFQAGATYQSSTLDMLNNADSDQVWNHVQYNNWDDFDNLLVHGIGGFGTYNSQANPWLSGLEQRTQFGLEALASSPLEIGADVRSVVGVTGDPNYPGDPVAYKLLSNDQVIWTDQDDRSDYAQKVAGTSNYDVRSKIITNFGQTGTRAVGILNRSDTATPSITFSFNTLRRDDGSLGGGVHSVQHIYYLWGFDPNTGNMPDLVNSSGSITLGTGLTPPCITGQSPCPPVDTAYPIHYSCNATQCTFGNAQQPIPAHALILVKVQGTSDTSLLSAETLGTLRNDFTGPVGMQYTTGSSPITVTHLGRIFVAGNTGTHTVGIYSLSSGTPLASCSVTASSGNADSLGFEYCRLSTPYTLAANTTYAIASTETTNGDQWYDFDTTVTVRVGTVSSAAYFYTGQWNQHGSGSVSYVPVNFVYNN